MNVALLVKKVALTNHRFAHINAFPDVSVKKVSYDKPMIKVNAYQKHDVHAVQMNISMTVAQLVLTHVQHDLNHAQNNVYRIAFVKMASFV